MPSLPVEKAKRLIAQARKSRYRSHQSDLQIARERGALPRLNTFTGIAMCAFPILLIFIVINLVQSFPLNLATILCLFSGLIPIYCAHKIYEYGQVRNLLETADAENLSDLPPPPSSLSA